MLIDKLIDYELQYYPPPLFDKQRKKAFNENSGFCFDGKISAEEY